MPRNEYRTTHDVNDALAFAYKIEELELESNLGWLFSQVVKVLPMRHRHVCKILIPARCQYGEKNNEHEKKAYQRFLAALW